MESCAFRGMDTCVDLVSRLGAPDPLTSPKFVLDIQIFRMRKRTVKGDFAWN